MRNRVWLMMACIALSGAAAVGGEFQWDLVPINEESKYEAAGVADVNGDGEMDILCGEYWYEGPGWTPHQFAELVEHDEYYDDFAHDMQDVDSDGDVDLLSCTWFSKAIFWRENPGDASGIWATHPVDEPGNMETGVPVDINGDGENDFLPNISTEVAWYEKTPGKAEWTKRVVGKDGAGHGLGYGDLNSDGVIDLITPAGWYEGANENGAVTWTWHPEFTLGMASMPILAMDVDSDGDQDVIWGMGHDFGVFWLEQSENGDQRVWTRHTIDDSWSQAHYIALVDLKDDGTTQLITGKRYRAHNGHDPGSDGPLGIYVYEYDSQNEKWTRQAVSEGGNVGFGLNPAIADVDGDGDLDIVCPGKSGLFLAKLR